MSIEGMCAHGIVTADRSRTLQECAVLMGQNHVGLLLVTEEAPGGPVAAGIVTDRDFVVEAMARGMPAGETTIGQIAVKRLLTVRSDASIEDAIQVMKKEGVRRLLVAAGDGHLVGVMKKEGVRRLLVAAGDGHLVGVISMDDLIDALAGEVLGIVQAIRSGITREAAAIRSSCVLCGERSVRLPKL